jgi:diacylglycerol kinase family enzyme
MAGIGVLINAGAGGVRRSPERVERMRRLLPAERIAVTRARGEVAAALRGLRAREVDTLVVVGGDGSVHVALTELFRVWPPDALPRVALARGGTINTIASSLGAHEAPDSMLERLLERGPRRECVRPALRVRADDGEERCAMIFAMGAAARFLEQYYAAATGGPLQAFATLARCMGSVLVHGPLARWLFSRFEARVRIDSDAYGETSFTVIAAASVRHIGLGFRPFHSAGRRLDRFHFAMTRDDGRRIALELPWHRAGVPPRRSCLRHASPARVTIEAPEPVAYTLDGDLFAPTKTVSIEATAPLRFLV